MGFPPTNSDALEVNVQGAPWQLEWWQWALIGGMVIAGIFAVGYLLRGIPRKKE